MKTSAPTEPTLLRAPAGHADHAHIAVALSIPQPQLAYLFEKHPSLVRMPARQLIPRMQRLAQVLEVPMQQVRGARPSIGPHTDFMGFISGLFPV